jgi:succinate dehydrogenase hydrophobic membrane anchor protein
VRADLAPLREREFRLLFAGRAVSLLGSAIAPVALAFAVLDLTGSKTDLGLILAAREIPLILFLLVGGIFADRIPRNRVMVGANTASALSQATAAALLITGNAEVWHLALLAAVNGGASAFFFPASAGVIPQTVPAPLLQQANALLQLAMSSASIGGAAIAGFLVAAVGSGWAIGVDAGTYVLAASLVSLMRLPPLLGRETASFFFELADGWREFRSRPWLWAIVLQFSILLMVTIGAFSVLGPVVADEELGGPKAWGAILTAQAAGFVVGGLVGLRFRPRRMLLVATVAIMAMPAPLLALGFPLGLVWIAALAFVAGFGIEIFSLLWNTTVQQEVPPAKLSRVYSYDALGSLALVPLGLWFAGSVIALAGAPHAEFVAWLSSPLAAILMVLLLAIGFHHLAIGIQVVIEDYVHHEGAKIAALVVVKAACAVLAVAGIFAVLKIAFTAGGAR